MRSNRMLDGILKEESAKAVIDYVNHTTPDEAKRCRLLLAAVLFRLEAREQTG